MNQLWLNKKQNQKCILFFNGWGMDGNAIKQLDFGGFDLYMVNNFCRFEPLKADFSNYQSVVLIAWSLGVWAAEQVISLSPVSMHKRIAINGTTCPIHDQYGIPEDIFASTLTGWNELNREKFNWRTMGGRRNTKIYQQLLSVRSIDDQKEELQAIYTTAKNNHAHPVHWDSAVIGYDDLIFSAANQLNWWADKAQVIKTSWPHFPFMELRSWDQLINI